MILTNNNQLPEAIFFWIKAFNDHNEAARAKSIEEYKAKYSASFEQTISVTSLMKSPREIVLLDRHHDDIVREASDIYDAIIGTAVHDSFEKMPMRENEEREVRVGVVINGVLVHGEFDDLLNMNLRDYKTMKIGGYVFGDKEAEFTQQLSSYRFCYYAERGKLINEIGNIDIIFVDWRLAEYKNKKYGFSPVPNYPMKSIEIPIKMWDIPQTERWITRRVADYRVASLMRDDELPLCTDTECWVRVGKKKTTYAKCEQYCSAAPFCNQALARVQGGN